MWEPYDLTQREVQAPSRSGRPVPEEGERYPVGILEVEDLARGDPDGSGVLDAMGIEMSRPPAHRLLGANR